MPEYVHAFDLDNTLIRGALLARAFTSLAKKGMLNLNDAEIHEIAAIRDTGSHNEYMLAMINGYNKGIRGCSVKQIRKVAFELAQADVKDIYPEMQVIIDDIKAHNGHIVIISGSPRVFVHAFGQVIGARVADGSHYYAAKGVFHASRPHQESTSDKAARLTSISKHLNAEIVSAYGDSMADYSMLCLAANPVVVNPHPELRALAEERDWRIIQC